MTQTNQNEEKTMQEKTMQENKDSIEESCSKIYNVTSSAIKEMHTEVLEIAKAQNTTPNGSHKLGEAYLGALLTCALEVCRGVMQSNEGAVSVIRQFADSAQRELEDSKKEAQQEINDTESGEENE